MSPHPALSGSFLQLQPLQARASSMSSLSIPTKRAADKTLSPVSPNEKAEEKQPVSPSPVQRRSNDGSTPMLVPDSSDEPMWKNGREPPRTSTRLYLRGRQKEEKMARFRKCQVQRSPSPPERKQKELPLFRPESSDESDGSIDVKMGESKPTSINAPRHFSRPIQLKRSPKGKGRHGDPPLGNYSSSPALGGSASSSSISGDKKRQTPLKSAKSTSQTEKSGANASSSLSPCLGSPRPTFLAHTSTASGPVSGSSPSRADPSGNSPSRKFQAAVRTDIPPASRHLPSPTFSVSTPGSSAKPPLPPKIYNLNSLKIGKFSKSVMPDTLKSPEFGTNEGVSAFNDARDIGPALSQLVRNTSTRSIDDDTKSVASTTAALRQNLSATTLKPQQDFSVDDPLDLIWAEWTPRDQGVSISLYTPAYAAVVLTDRLHKPLQLPIIVKSVGRAWAKYRVVRIHSATARRLQTTELYRKLQPVDRKVIHDTMIEDLKIFRSRRQGQTVLPELIVVRLSMPGESEVFARLRHAFAVTTAGNDYLVGDRHLHHGSLVILENLNVPAQDRWLTLDAMRKPTMGKVPAIICLEKVDANADAIDPFLNSTRVRLVFQDFGRITEPFIMERAGSIGPSALPLIDREIVSLRLAPGGNSVKTLGHATQLARHSSGNNSYLLQEPANVGEYHFFRVVRITGHTINGTPEEIIGRMENGILNV